MRLLRLVIIISSVLYMLSCQREQYTTDPSAKLRFSVDTVYFDTVFTALHTVTKRFTVHNPNSEFIKISSVNLAGGSSSVYRLNFDGVPGTEFENVEIPPKDSLFMFVEATLDPNNSSGILLQQDSVVFVTNKNVQDVDLVAWGQDVHMLRDTIFNSDTWTNDKPYLIIGYAALDSAQLLTIQPGTRIYFHRDSYLLIAGTLVVNGTLEEPVKFSGDRLERLYDDIPGQYTGIIFHPWSRNNVMDYAEIKGGMVGIVVQNDTNLLYQVDLELKNTKIQHISSYGIRAAHSKITAYNTLLSDCGISAITLEGGGSYEFYHTTIANWFGYNTRNTPSLIFSNYAVMTNQNGDKNTVVKDLVKATFANSIIYGGNRSEVYWSEDESGAMNFSFENCLVKIDTSEGFSLSKDSHFLNCLNNRDPLFLNTDKYDFHFDTVKVSPGRDFGNPAIGLAYPSDLDGVSRVADGKPDAGVYEFIRPD
jgi:hypothetical protein